MRFGHALALALLVSACGDPIEVGNASDQAGLANDRKLADLSEEIHGTWRTNVSIENTPFSIDVELTLAGDEDDNDRSGAFTMKCIGPVCDVVSPIPGADGGFENRRLGDAIEGAGTYQLIELDGQGTAAGILRDGGPTTTEFSVPKGAGTLEFALRLASGRQLSFTRVP